MRRLHEAASSNVDARLAIQMFCYSVRKQVAAMIAALDGVDLVVFTGGIGENDGKARAAICEQSHQRSRIALPGARSRLAGRRADRPPYLGIVPTESFLIGRRQRLLKRSATPPMTRQEQTPWTHPTEAQRNSEFAPQLPGKPMNIFSPHRADP
jgi:hypothetical protein